MRPLALATITSLLALSGAAQATNVGVSIGISQPGVYGRIDVGRFRSLPWWYPSLFGCSRRAWWCRHPRNRCTFGCRLATASTGIGIARSTAPAAYR